jgi:hypothetical protein
VVSVPVTVEYLICSLQVGSSTWSHYQHVGKLISSFLPLRDSNRCSSISTTFMLVPTSPRTLRRLGANERRILGKYTLCVHPPWWRSCIMQLQPPRLRHTCSSTHDQAQICNHPVATTAVILQHFSLALSKNPLLHGTLVYATTFPSPSLMLARLYVTNEPSLVALGVLSRFYYVNSP